MENIQREILDSTPANSQKIVKGTPIGSLGGGKKAAERVNAEQWNAVLLAQGGSFLQSWEWCLFQQKYGRRVTFLAMSEDTFAWDLKNDAKKDSTKEYWHDMQLQTAIFEHSLPLGLHYLYIPRGPALSGAFESSHGELFDRFSIHITELAKQRGSAFMRVEPAFPLHWREHAIEHLEEMGFSWMANTMQPSKNLIINLGEPELVLKRHMHQKTRYNIKVAKKHGVNVMWMDGNEGADSFIRLNSETARRRGIKTYDAKYFKDMFENIPPLKDGGSDILSMGLRHRLYFASYEGNIIATAAVFYFGDRVTYLHGGSSWKNKNVMAPYLLHWQIMKDAKALGYTEYDIGGVDEEKWPGITRFKQGFAGWIEEFPGLFELSLSRTKYGLYRMLKKIKR